MPTAPTANRYGRKENTPGCTTSQFTSQQSYHSRVSTQAVTREARTGRFHRRHRIGTVSETRLCQELQSAKGTPFGVVERGHFGARKRIRRRAQVRWLPSGFRLARSDSFLNRNMNASDPQSRATPAPNMPKASHMELLVWETMREPAINARPTTARTKHHLRYGFIRCLSGRVSTITELAEARHGRL